MAQYTKSQLVSASNATYFTNTSGGISASAVRDLNDSWISSSALLSGSNTFIGNQIISGNLDITGTITASLQTGYLYVGDSSGKTQAVATSSIIANTDTSSLLVTASFASTNITFTKGDATTFNLPGFATTGSNTFNGDQIVNGKLTISSSANSYLQFTSPNNQTGSGQIFFGSLGPYIQTYSDSLPDNQGLQLVAGLSGSFALATRYGGGGAKIDLDAMADQTNPAGARGRLQVKTNGQIDLSGFGGAITISGSQTTIQGLTYPSTDGTNGQVITTNGSGVLTFTTVASSIDTGSFLTTGSLAFGGSTNKGNGVYQFNIATGSAGYAIEIFNTGSDALYGGTGSMRFGITDPGNPFIQLKGQPWFQFGTSNQLQFQSFTSSYDNGIIIGPYYTASAKVHLMPRSSSLQFSQDIGSGEVPIFTLGTKDFSNPSQSIFETDLRVKGQFTASLANGFTYVGNASGISTLVATSSFGSSIDTGSFATTGSNTFTGVNTFNERTNLQGINVYTGSASGIYIGDRTNFAPTTAGNIPGNQHTIVGQGALNSFGNGDLNAAFGPSALYVLVSGSSNLAMGGFAGYALVNGNTNTFIGDQSGNGMKGGDNNFFLGSSAGNNFRTGSYNIMIGLNTQGNLATGSGNLFIGTQGGTLIENNVDNQLSIKYGTDLSPRRLLYKSGSEAANLYLYGGLEIENTFTASLTQGYAWVGNSSNRTTLVATSSFGGGTTYINPTLNPYSGSLILVANTFTSSSFAHISASANGQVNLVFKNNNNTGDTILSGSGNIFTNPIAPSAGFKRFATSGNISLSGNLPQMSGSMAFPITMSNNYFGSVTGTTFLGMRGPVSSSAWSINNNIVQLGVNIGSSAALHAEKLVSGLTLNSNNFLGALNLIANQSALSSSVTINGNIIAGTTTLYLSSSAAAIANNIINDSGFTFTNQYYSSSLGLGSVSMNRNNIGGQNNLIIISGSLPVGGAQSNSISDNFIFGGSNQIYIDVQNARLNGSAVYKNVIRTGLLGNNLIVSGSSLLADGSSYGSVFVGRYNADDNRRNKTSDTVFAVGTGNTTTRKTGFLIDSGSNTYVEGTFNVSGSTAFTGSVAMSSFTTLASVSSSLNFADDTAAAAGGVPLGGLYRNGNFVMIRLT